MFESLSAFAFDTPVGVMMTLAASLGCARLAYLRLARLRGAPVPVEARRPGFSPSRPGPAE